MEREVYTAETGYTFFCVYQIFSCQIVCACIMCYYYIYQKSIIMPEFMQAADKFEEDDR